MRGACRTASGKTDFRAPLDKLPKTDDAPILREQRSGEGAMSAKLVRGSRVLVGIIATGLITTLSAFGAASPARADLVPYVPWSSYLPGWTDEYVPASDNDCAAGRSNCLQATLKEQSRIADQTASACSHNAIFARAYVRMTQLYGFTRDIPGYYEDVRYFNHVDAVFARYYTDSYYNWQNGN